jgi:hypothetical protein
MSLGGGGPVRHPFLICWCSAQQNMHHTLVLEVPPAVLHKESQDPCPEIAYFPRFEIRPTLARSLQKTGGPPSREGEG